MLWGGWLLVTGLAFSLGQGIIHEYYTVALAPAIGAVIGIGATAFWAHRDNPLVRVFLGFTVAASAVWAYVLLDRVPSWHPGLRTVVLLGGLALGAALAVTPTLRGRLGVAFAVVAVVVGLAAPTAYTLSTVSTPHTGAIPLAGPASAATGPGGFGRAGARPGFGGFNANGNAGGAFPRFNGGGRQAFGGARGGLGGLLDGSTPGKDVTALFKADRGYRWTAATVGANEAAGYQLASGKAVMAIGGFNGTDPAPTLGQFEQYVKDGDIHYFIAGRGFGAGGGTGTTSAITQWVENNFTARTVDNVTIYDLTSPVG